MVMREKLIRFMYGRYGVDKLSRHVVFAALPLWIASIFLGCGFCSFWQYWALSVVTIGFFPRTRQSGIGSCALMRDFWEKSKGFRRE